LLKSILRRPVSIADLRHRHLEPNFTAILPGKCQARCPFCIEPEGPAPPSISYWLTSFSSLLNSELPPNFSTVSLSGGEPSLSPAFPDALSLLAQHRISGRLKRTVLTTNGFMRGMTAHLDTIGRAITNVNISRHATDDGANIRVFKSRGVPGKADLTDLVSELNRRGVPVNLNCVYSAEHAFGASISTHSRSRIRAEAKRYISFAQEIGASSVVFRFDHRTWNSEKPTRLEAAFDDYAIVHQASCASCCVVGKVIGGLPVNFKRSAYEPVELHLETELYELVLHSDGALYRDWSRLHPVARPLPRMQFMAEAWEALHSRRMPMPAFESDCAPPDAPCGLLTTVPE
jgi:hypothetical protein